MDDLDFKKKFAKLSGEEKRAFVRNLIHESGEAADINAAFLDPKTKQVIRMSDMAKQFGEEETIDMIVKALESVDTETLKLSETDVKELIKKKERGECTQEELYFLDYIINSKVNSDDSVQFGYHWLEDTISLIDFAQKKVKYQPKVHDLLFSSSMLVLTSCVFRDNSSLNKFKNCDKDMVFEVISQLGDDIYNTWKNSCKTLPESELIILGLLEAASKIAYKENIPFASANIVEEILGIKSCYNDDDENENGSNESPDCKMYKPVTYNIKTSKK